MRSGTRSGVLLTVLLFATAVTAQDSASSNRTERFRQELFEVQAKEAELRSSLEQLNEAVKPENIERSLAGVGSTRPEELREHRRRVLTIERDGVIKQLSRLEERRVTLEAAIATATTEAYLRSAQPPSSPSTQMFVSGNVAGPRRWWIALPLGVGAIAIFGLAGYAIVRNRSSHRTAS